MLTCQKDLFSLPNDLHYLNGAYMSPQLKSVEEVGIKALQLKNNPVQIQSDDFFEHSSSLRKAFSVVINAPIQQTAIIPSASYGLMTAVQNVPPSLGKKVLVLEDEFPSGYYSLERWCKNYGGQIITVTRPVGSPQVGRAWQEKLLDSIRDDVAILLMSTVHWADGTAFDLKVIGERCKDKNVIFILDGTQSIGARPFDLDKIHVDALVTAGYKWMLGPYSLGMAYYSPFFNYGIPLEESWMNRTNARDFANLTQYVDQYEPGAGRYAMGESSNFILVPMLEKAISQILQWGVEEIDSYAKLLAKPLIPFLNSNGFGLEDSDFRANHLFGIHLPEFLDRDLVVRELKKRNIFVSVRGKAIRVSLSVYNHAENINAFQNALADILVMKN